MQSAVESSDQEGHQATDASPAEGSGQAAAEPVVVDPVSRNLVADMQQRIQPTQTESAPVAFQPHQHSRHAMHDGQPQPVQEQSQAAHSYASLHNDTVWYPDEDIDFGSAGQFGHNASFSQPGAEEPQASAASQQDGAENHAADGTAPETDESHPAALRHARTHAPAPVNAEATSVIDPKELQAYFARWASQQEETDGDSGDDDDNDEESKE